MKPCRACLTRRATRPRGLCWTCYNTPGVPERFPSTSKFARKAALGVGDQLDFEGPAADDEGPTDARPGSEEKLRVLVARAALGRALFHPKDRTHALTGLALLAHTEGHDDD